MNSAGLKLNLKLSARAGTMLERKLGPEFSSEGAEELDAATLDQLFNFVRQAEECRLEGVGAEKLADWLEVVPPSTETLETLGTGATLLHQWLAQQQVSRSTGSNPIRWFVAGGITATFALGMAFFSSLLVVAFDSGSRNSSLANSRSTTRRATHNNPGDF